jgi:DNA-binding CsgD family transcriptional regulator
VDAVVGRQSELGQVHDVLVAARDGGQGAIVVLTGPAGIGKTALVDSMAGDAGALGLPTVVTAAAQLDRGRPFGPLLDAFGSGLGAPEPPDEERLRHSPFETTPAARTRLADAITDAVEDRVQAGPLLVILDDAHWADTETLSTLSRLHRLATTNALVLVVAMRRTTRADVTSYRMAASQAGAITIDLEALPTADVVDLATRLAGDPPDASLVSLLERTAGNPLLVVELVSALRRGDRLVVRDGHAGLDAGPPVELDRLIDRHIGDLDDDVGQMLRVAAVIGPTFEVDELAAVLRRAPAELLPMLDAAMTAELLVDDDERVRFRHELLREAAESALGPSARRALHRDIAQTLEARHAPALRVAAHYALGASPGDASAIASLLASADDVVGRSPAAAVSLLERALELLEPFDSRRDEVAVRLVEARFWAGQIDAAVDDGERLVARKLPATVEAELRSTLARTYVLLGRPADAVEQSARMQQVDDRADDRAWNQALTGLFRLFALDIDGALDDLRAAHAEAGADDEASALALAGQSWIENIRGYHDRAVELADEAVRLADRSDGGGAHRAIPHLFRGLALESASHPVEALETLRRGQLISEQLGTTWATPFYHYALALPHWNAAAWDELIAETTAGLRYAADNRIGLIASWACGVTAGAHLHGAELDEAERRLDEGDGYIARGGVQYGIEYLTWGRAVLLEARGDRAEGMELLRAGCEVSVALEANAAHILLAPDLVRMAVLAGDLELAGWATSGIDRGRMDADRLNVDAIASRCRALVDSDLDLLREAHRIHEQCQRPVDVAYDLEATMIAAARSGSMSDARDALDACVEWSRPRGMVLVAGRALGTATDLGVVPRSRSRAARRPRPVSGWDALTRTERRVAALVAVGRSNPEIADELVVSRRTVESHLYRIFTKLGVKNRTEVAVAVLPHVDGPATAVAPA